MDMACFMVFASWMEKFRLLPSGVFGPHPRSSQCLDRSAFVSDRHGPVTIIEVFGRIDLEGGQGGGEEVGHTYGALHDFLGDLIA